MSDRVPSAVVSRLSAPTTAIQRARHSAHPPVTSRAWRVAAFAVVSLCAPACRAYRPIDPPSISVEPIRVRFGMPRDIVLRRQSPDSVLHSVSRLEGTLLWLDRDSLRLDVTRAESAGNWSDVSSPSTAAFAVDEGTVVEHRRLSRTRTVALIAVVWIGATIAVLASLN